MNNLGYSNDNLHIGDTYIKGNLNVSKDLEIEGSVNVNDINVNSLTIGDPEYTLPTSAGTEGQIIVMNADNTTSDWQDFSTGNARIWQNLFTMKNYNPSQSLLGAYQNFDNGDGYGTKILNNIDEEFKVGGMIKVNITGQYEVSRSGTTTNRVGIRFGFLQNYDVFTPIVLQNTTFTGVGVVFGYFNIECVYTRISATEVLLSGLVVSFYKGATAGDLNQGNSDTPNVFSFQNPAITLPITITGFVAGGTYAISTSYVDLSTINGQIKMRASKYTIDICNPDSTILATSATLTTDHLLLSNINGGAQGDGGHINLFDKRGIKPMTGNINMNNNNIINANEISKTTPSGANFEIKNNDGPLVLSAQGGLSNIQLVTTNNVIANCNLFESTAAVNLFNANIVLFGNQIQQATAVTSTGTLECNATADLRLVGDIIDVVSNNTINQTIGPTTKMTIDSLETTTFNDINMDNNDLKNALNIIDQSTNNKINMNDVALLNAINISSNGNGILLQETSTTNRIGINNGGVSSSVANGGTIIQNTDAGNDLTLSKTNGGKIFLQNTGTGGVVELESEGIDINYTTNNFKVRNVLNTHFVIDGTDTESFLNFKCPSINGRTPSGGLYAGTSDGTLITATTTETSILPLASVGGLTVPANTFVQGESFHFVCSGNFSSNNGDTATLRVKANGTDLGSIIVSLTGSSNEFFEIEIDFTIRQTGAPTIADIVANIDFTYSDAGATSWRGSRNVSVNNSTFSTEISNTLDVTCQFSSTSANNSLQTRQATLGQVY